MDAPVDFSLDRARLLNGNLASGGLGSYNGVNYSEGGHVSSMNRNAVSSGSLQDLGRVATPARLSSAEYQSRYVHPSLSLSAQGKSLSGLNNQSYHHC